MSGTPAIPSPELMRAEKRSAAGNSVLAAIVITGLKIVVGVTTGSLGILSEAAHSGLDLIASLLTFFSVGVSDKPADADHQYGHGKVENFSAFVETGLLLLTCAWIIYEAALRLFFRRIEIEPSFAAFAVMLFLDGSRLVAFARPRTHRQQVRQPGARSRCAAFLHRHLVGGRGRARSGTGSGGTHLSRRLAARLRSDCRSVRRWSRGFRELAAGAPHHRRSARCRSPGVRSQIYDAVSRVDGVLEVDRVRIRRAGNRYFADLAVGLARTVTFQRSGQLAAAVTDSVRRILPDADVTVQPLPRAQRSENVFDRIRAVATHRNLNVHDISVQDLAGRLHVEQHIELDERMTLKQAHDQVTELEADMRHDVPEISDILTHIESEPATIEKPEELVGDAELEHRLKAVAAQFPEILDVHEFIFKRVRGRLYRLVPLHAIRRSFPRPRARYPDRARNPLQAGRAGIVPRPDSPRTQHR